MEYSTGSLRKEYIALEKVMKAIQEQDLVRFGECLSKIVLALMRSISMDYQRMTGFIIIT